ncbi:MAG: hypothetical protein CMI26_05590 [Opitutae bacterium]|nr:hypothetical protein [Opitutae bacterium]
MSSTLKTKIAYDEHGIVRNVFGNLNFDGKEATFYNFEPNEEGWFELPLTNYKIGTAKRVSKDWQLPAPPKGLPKLENVSDEIIDGDAKNTEGDDQNASE